MGSRLHGNDAVIMHRVAHYPERMSELQKEQGKAILCAADAPGIFPTSFPRRREFIQH